MERLDFTPFANAVEAQVSKLFDMAIQKKSCTGSCCLVKG